MLCITYQLPIVLQCPIGLNLSFSLSLAPLAFLVGVLCCFLLQKPQPFYGAEDRLRWWTEDSCQETSWTSIAAAERSLRARLGSAFDPLASRSAATAACCLTTAGIVVIGESRGWMLTQTTKSMSDELHSCNRKIPKINRANAFSNGARVPYLVESTCEVAAAAAVILGLQHEEIQVTIQQLIDLLVVWLHCVPCFAAHVSKAIGGHSQRLFVRIREGRQRKQIRQEEVDLFKQTSKEEARET